MSQLDNLDAQILQLMLEEPRAGVREYARRLGSARATIQNRIDRMIDRGVIANFSPTLDPAELGFPLAAKIHLMLRQSNLDHITEQLTLIPFITQADSLAGTHDMLCSVVARDHAHLEDITQKIMSIAGVERTKTDIVLRRRIPHRTAQLVAAASESPPPAEQR